MTKKNFFSMLKSVGLPLSTRELHDITQYYVVLADGGRVGPESSSSAVTNVLGFNVDHSQTAADASDARSRFSDKGSSTSNHNSNNTSSSGEYADFMGLLRDARLLASSAAARRGSLPEEDEDVDIDLDMDADLDDAEDVRSYTQVLGNLKSMLLESTKSLGKHQDDVYRMFARWDTQGMGTVTATQFLRVLARLHVELSDQDQDFLVELLDTNAMGRIDFESLLNFCFSSAHGVPQSDSLDYMLSSPLSTLKHSHGHNGGALARAPEDFTGETVSAVSTGTKDFSVEHSRASKPLQRPHTASSTLSRPYSAEQPLYLDQPPYGMQLQTHSLQLPAAGSLSLSDDPSPQQPNHSQQQQKVAYRRMNSDGNYTSSSFAAGDAVGGTSGVVGGGAAANQRVQRPQTASGRVNSSSSSSNHSENIHRQNRDDGNHSSSKEAKKLGGIATYGHLDSIYDDIEVYDGDDALLDEHHLALPHSYSSERKTDSGCLLQPDQDSWSERQLAQQKPNCPNFEELATSLTADQHEFDFGSINDIPEIGRVNNGSGWVNHTPHERLDFRKGLDYGSERSWVGGRAADGYAIKPGEPLEEEDDLNCEVQEDDPIDHLVLLATQILSTLRDIVMTRYRRGKSLMEIYQHFDRDEKHYFDAKDFVTATSDLRLETSQRVAAIAVNLIALDGFDKVSYGEFKVFVLDSDHKLLELNIQEQLAQQLEQHGRGYQSWMVEMFWNEEDSLNDSARMSSKSERDRQNGTIQKSAFTASLQKIGAVLTSSELSRLVDRFDLHGTDMCSVSRFVRMIQTSEAWRHAEKVLCYQEEAKEEAQFLRQQLRLRRAQQNRSGSEEDGQLGIVPGDVTKNNGTNTVNSSSLQGLPELPEELINICEYLGIRVLSEQNMLWIAADALKAPLPVSWTAQKDGDGRTYFHNHLTNQSRWEHPLDPHFRKLRDKYRQSNAGLDSGGVGGRSSLVLAGHAIRERSGSGSVNSCGYGGSTPPLPAVTNSNNSAAVTLPVPAKPRPSAPSPVPPTHLPEDPQASPAGPPPARPKSAVPERTEHQQLAYRNLQLVPPQPQQRPPLQPKTAQSQQQSPQPQQAPAPRPGSAPAVAPSPSQPLVPANGLLYSMTLGKELKPFNPLATNNSFIPSLEVRNKLVTEAIYAPVPLFKPAPRNKLQKAHTNSSHINNIMNRELNLTDWEAEASKGDLRFYVSSGARPRPSTPSVSRNAANNSNSNSSRPSSSSRRAGHVGGSAVDRAVGLGRAHSHSSGLGLGQKQQQRLASMFDGGLIDKLDNIIVAKSSSSSALTSTALKGRKDGKGGIVVL